MSSLQTNHVLEIEPEKDCWAWILLCSGPLTLPLFFTLSLCLSHFFLPPSNRLASLSRSNQLSPSPPLSISVPSYITFLLFAYFLFPLLHFSLLSLFSLSLRLLFPLSCLSLLTAEPGNSTPAPLPLIVCSQKKKSGFSIKLDVIRTTPALCLSRAVFSSGSPCTCFDDGSFSSTLFPFLPHPVLDTWAPCLCVIISEAQLSHQWAPADLNHSHKVENC